MKRMISVAVQIALVLSLALPTLASGQGPGSDPGNRPDDPPGDGPGPSPGPQARKCSVPYILRDMAQERLNRRERSDLLYIREQEKLTRDVHLSLYERWRHKAFRKVAYRERSHISWALVLLDKYQLDDPALNLGVGVFSRNEFQNLYTELVRLGSDSVGAGLTVSAAIHEMNIYTLRTRALRRARNQDLRTLYQNLMKVSRNHLRNFHRLLAKRGIEYEPAYLSVATYFDIVDSPSESGVVDAEGEWMCSNRK